MARTSAKQAEEKEIVMETADMDRDLEVSEFVKLLLARLESNPEMKTMLGVKKGKQ